MNLSKISTSSKNAKSLYLWTEKGALLHAKSLGTNQAWDTYETLVDRYYDVKEQLDELTALARRNGFVTFAQFNENRFSVGRTIRTLNSKYQTFTKFGMVQLLVSLHRILYS